MNEQKVALCGRRALLTGGWERTVVGKLVLAVLFAVLTGVGSLVRVPLPGTPVPLTAQVFVLLVGIPLLGPWAGVSQALYVLGGLAGIPWFTGGSGVVLPVTFGYLGGFVAGAFVSGMLVESARGAVSFRGMFVRFLPAVALIHLCGIAWLVLYLHIGLGAALAAGCGPFVAADLLKAAAAAGLAHRLRVNH